MIAIDTAVYGYSEASMEVHSEWHVKVLRRVQRQIVTQYLRRDLPNRDEVKRLNVANL